MQQGGPPGVPPSFLQRPQGGTQPGFPGAPAGARPAAQQGEGRSVVQAARRVAPRTQQLFRSCAARDSHAHSCTWHCRLWPATRGAICQWSQRGAAPGPWAWRAAGRAPAAATCASAAWPHAAAAARAAADGGQCAACPARGSAARPASCHGARATAAGCRSPASGLPNASGGWLPLRAPRPGRCCTATRPSSGSSSPPAAGWRAWAPPRLAAGG